MQELPLPRFVERPAQEPALHDCHFYHTIDLPGLGTMAGQWDLRPGIGHYFGDTEFRGARVLEIGTASGFLCFEIERRGAEVLAFDLDERLTYDPKPGAQVLPLEEYRLGTMRQRNSFWLSHHRLGSRARFACGHAGHLPAMLGQFDIGVMGNVLQHLQDPVGAVIQLAARCDRIVITEGDWYRGQHDELSGLIYFKGPRSPFSWYQVKPTLLRDVLTDCGFVEISESWHEQCMMVDTVHRAGESPSLADAGALMVPHFTMVARRPPGSR